MEIDAADVGSAEGVAVGASVGSTVGVAVGASVGVGVGSIVGVGVGTSVGAGVGSTVGVAVGSSVGAAVNASTVGVAVGMGVSGDASFRRLTPITPISAAITMAITPITIAVPPLRRFSSGGWAGRPASLRASGRSRGTSLSARPVGMPKSAPSMRTVPPAAVPTCQIESSSSEGSCKRCRSRFIASAVA